MSVPSKAQAAAKSASTSFTIPREFNYLRYGLTLVLVLSKLGVLGTLGYESMRTVSWVWVFLPAFVVEAGLLTVLISLFVLVTAVVLVGGVLALVFFTGLWLVDRGKALVRRVRRGRRRTQPLDFSRGVIDLAAVRRQHAWEADAGVVRSRLRQTPPSAELDRAIQNAIKTVSKQPKPPTP